MGRPNGPTSTAHLLSLSSTIYGCRCLYYDKDFQAHYKPNIQERRALCNGHAFHSPLLFMAVDIFMMKDFQAHYNTNIQERRDLCNGPAFHWEVEIKTQRYIFRPIISPIFKNAGPYIMGLHHSPHLFMAVGVFIMIKIEPNVMGLYSTGPHKKGPYVMGLHFTGPHKLKLTIYFQAHYKPDNQERLNHSSHLFMRAVSLL